eukprot:5949614-Pleurochrysis_carterae.AAC.1
MHKAAKRGGVVGNVRSSRRCRVEDASDELEVRLAFFLALSDSVVTMPSLLRVLTRWALSVDQAAILVGLRSLSVQQEAVIHLRDVELRR